MLSRVSREHWAYRGTLRMRSLMKPRIVLESHNATRFLRMAPNACERTAQTGESSTMKILQVLVWCYDNVAQNPVFRRLS